MDGVDYFRFSSLPDQLRAIFLRISGTWKHRHGLILYWVVFSMAMNEGKNTIKGLADNTPKAICKNRIRGGGLLD
ncbi:MAG: hypothetical protein AB8G05_25745 [Oligoflexales bacterium]